MWLSKLQIWFAITVFLLAGAARASAAPDFEQLTIADYEKIRQVSELALSSDGEWIAAVIESSEEPGAARTILVKRTQANSPPLELPIAHDARHLAWIPGRYELAYISAVNGAPQLFKIDINTQTSVLLTQGKEPVISFQFSKSGNRLGWITQSEQNTANDERSLYDRLHQGETGVVIDYQFTRLNHFITPRFREAGADFVRSLWVADFEQKPSKVYIPGKIVGFEWSPKGEKLSVRFLADIDRMNPFASLYTSIGVFDVASRKFSLVARATNASTERNAVYYLGGEWSDDGDDIFVRRVRPSGFWRSQREWRRVPVDKENLSVDDSGWNEVKFFPSSAKINQHNDGKTIVHAINNAKRSIYSIDEESPVAMPDVANVGGDVALAQYSSDGEVLAFVNERHDRAPEIYIRRNGDLTKITNINESINVKQMPDVREVFWRGEDGASLQGWLLLPPGSLELVQPLPMVTFLHGGPAMPMTDSFAQYYKLYGGVWPYPLEILALNGIAVFIPNYRGTESFGHQYANPESSDGEAPSDVILGIEKLVEAGLADKDRLGIAGHSHGAWLGALVMSKRKGFIAASFGEGPQNNMLTYIFSPGYLYEEGYHKLWGDGLYQSPQRYIETSPVFYFDGLKTATLFEAGIESQALTMMGSPKAAHLAGMPTEFIVYPRTGHNVRDPKLKREVAQRNLDWFLFWMLGHEGEESPDADQYDRWRKIRREGCNENGPEIAMVAYCDF